MCTWDVFWWSWCMCASTLYIGSMMCARENNSFEGISLGIDGKLFWFFRILWDFSGDAYGIFQSNCVGGAVACVVCVGMWAGWSVCWQGVNISCPCRYQHSTQLFITSTTQEIEVFWNVCPRERTDIISLLTLSCQIFAFLEFWTDVAKLFGK